jgi:hypothetical protein
MKHLRETFTEEEWREKLSKAKDISGLNWHDFLLVAAEQFMKKPIGKVKD